MPAVVGQTVIYHKPLNDDGTIVQDFPAIVIETHESWRDHLGARQQPSPANAVIQVLDGSFNEPVELGEGTDAGKWSQPAAPPAPTMPTLGALAAPPPAGEQDRGNKGGGV